MILGFLGEVPYRLRSLCGEELLTAENAKKSRKGRREKLFDRVRVMLEPRA
jgi:hypothetical protein